MAEIIYGSIFYKDKSYPFFLDGHRVYVVGSAWEYREDFKDADIEETIFGITSGNREIMFLRCKFGMASFQQRIWFSPIGYVLSRGNVGEPYDFTFEKISFYSEALNSFFPPQAALKTDFDLNNWNGKMSVILKPFEETDISFDYKECKCQINISRYINVKSGKSDLGNINSVFSFEFSTAQHTRELPQYWLALFDFLSFINYGKDIVFDKITLGKKREDGLFEYIADACIFSNRKEYTPKALPNTLIVDDIPSGKLAEIFSTIASLRGSDSRLHYYFPENFKESRWIDATRWLTVAINFDGLSTKCYPNFKQTENQPFGSAKAVALDALNTVDQGNMSAKERKYFRKCCEQIERYEGRLEEMLNFVVKKYECALEDILQFNLREHGVETNAYGEIYSEYRNKIAHGEILPIGDHEKAVYRVLQATVYFMILEGADLDSNTLRIIAKKLFL